jgi:hypothetical protein
LHWLSPAPLSPERIRTHDALFTGQDRCPEFDLCKEPLPEKLKILLCLLDGAERRRQIQARLNAGSLDGSPSSAVQAQSTKDQ